MCKALEELDIVSPLKECGLTKDDIRQLAKPLYDFVLKHIDLSETDIIQKYLEM